MRNHDEHLLMLRFQARAFFCPFLVATLLLLPGCSNDDPDPVNEEEVITTLTVTLVPEGGGANVVLKFYDEDGDGSIAPQTTVSGALAANKTYKGAITLLNETENPAGDITAEVKEEANDHLFCYTVSGSNLTVSYDDTDNHGLPVGLETRWVTTGAGTGKIGITLRHQPGEKTGACPGAGDSDIEVEFNITIQ
jgi:hypothetical protein